MTFWSATSRMREWAANNTTSTQLSKSWSPRAAPGGLWREARMVPCLWQFDRRIVLWWSHTCLILLMHVVLDHCGSRIHEIQLASAPSIVQQWFPWALRPSSHLHSVPPPHQKWWRCHSLGSRSHYCLHRLPLYSDFHRPTSLGMSRLLLREAPRAGANRCRRCVYHGLSPIGWCIGSATPQSLAGQMRGHQDTCIALVERALSMPHFVWIPPFPTPVAIREPGIAYIKHKKGSYVIWKMWKHQVRLPNREHLI